MEMNENDNALSTRITEETQRMVDLVMNEKKAREENKRLKSEINALEERIKTIEKSLVNLSDPDTQLKKQLTNIARDFTVLF